MLKCRDRVKWGEEDESEKESHWRRRTFDRRRGRWRERDRLTEERIMIGGGERREERVLPRRGPEQVAIGR